MNTRRSCLFAMTGLAATAAFAGASTMQEVLRVGPRPKLIKGLRGVPDMVDFGHGLLVPMSKDAFHALWEGDDRWITYGHGFGHRVASAMGQAEEAAIGTMKLYLITLAFAPERLMRIDGGGWRLKSGNAADLILGDIRLPGRPVMPAVDEVNGINGYATGDSSVPPASSSDAPSAIAANGEQPTHATTGWLVWKKDITLDYVRGKAILV
jgi:hypothetical protein